MHHVTLAELQRFSRAVHYGRAWRHVQALAKMIVTPQSRRQTNRSEP